MPVPDVVPTRARLNKRAKRNVNASAIQEKVLDDWFYWSRTDSFDWMEILRVLRFV